jgi:hypothetical protein
MATQTDSKIFGTKQFKEEFSICPSSQFEMRKKGMPFYRVPNSSKILYKKEEVLAWLTSQKGASADA